MSYLQEIAEAALAIADSDAAPWLPPNVAGMVGMTGTRVRLFLNAVCQRENCRHLEIGTHKGATLAAAMYGNPGEFVAVDSYPGRPDLPPQCDAALSNAGLAGRATIIREDCWQWAAAARREPGEQFTSYLYDGDHSEQAQFQAITLIDHLLAPECLLIVDDWNVGRVQRGTWRGITEAKRRPAWHAWRSSLPDLRSADGWWNGIGVILLAG